MLLAQQDSCDTRKRRLWTCRACFACKSRCIGCDHAAHQRKENTMSSKPTHRAFVVSTPKKEGEKGIWREIGAVWPHKNGKGFDVVIHEGISVHGRIVCTEPKKDEDKE